MDLRCDDVRNDAIPLTDERAEQIARHVDGCEAGDRELRFRVARAVEAFPARVAPSMDDVRRRIRNGRQSFFLRFAAAAAAALIVIGTGWAVLRHEQQQPPPTPAKVAAPPVDAPIPEPPLLAELPEIDRKFIQSDGIVSYYLQFCLSCLNRPTEEDKREFLIRALLVLREVRSSLKARCEKGGDPVEVVTRDGLIEALQTMRASPLESVKLLPSKFLSFRFEKDKWQFDHVLGSKNWRLTISPLPLYLNFAYMKKALNADDALMGRIEDALWFDLYVNLPSRIENKDPKIPGQALETVLPLLSPRQQQIYRKIVGSP